MLINRMSQKKRAVCRFLRMQIRSFKKLIAQKKTLENSKYRYILKTLENVTVAKFEVAFTQYRYNFNSIENLMLANPCNLLQEFDVKETYLHLRIDLSRFESVENIPFLSFSSVHKMLFSMCRFEYHFQNLPFSNLPAKNVAYSCKREACHIFVVFKLC